MQQGGLDIDFYAHATWPAEQKLPWGILGI
jgi:hypothetical protein